MATIGLDLGKTSVFFVGLDASGHVRTRRQYSKAKLLAVTSTMSRCRIGMEACCGAHHLGRALAAQGHDVRLMPPNYVKPFVKRDKNDSKDAEACAEACLRPTMRFVAVKSEQQLSMQSLHRHLSRLAGNSTQLVNQARAFLLERGIAVPKGKHKFAERLPEILEDADNGLPDAMRELLGHISKRGNKYLRTLLVHCARASLETLSKREDRLGAWLRRQLENKKRSVVIVALAARLARIAWALLHKRERFAPEPEAAPAR